MGPVSEEPGLSLWDAMSVLCRRRRARGRRPATGGRRGRGGPGSGRGAHSPFNRKSASIWREKRRDHETTGTRNPAGGGRRARAPGARPSLRPPGMGAPGRARRGQPSPPHRNFGASVRGLEVRCPLADRPWPGAPACQSRRSGPGPETAGGRGGARRSGGTWESLCRWSPLISAGAASAAGGKGRRGDAGGQDRPVRADGALGGSRGRGEAGAGAAGLSLRERGGGGGDAQTARPAASADPSSCVTA